MEAGLPTGARGREVLPLSGSLRIGRIAGIAIEVHYSWVLVFLLVTSSLLHVLQGGSGNVVFVWAAALGGSLLFFASVLAHELAHSLVANSFGRMIDRITLFVFGGLAHLRREPPSPKVEFLIAVAGPGMSMVLAVVFGAVALVCRLIPLDLGPVQNTLSWLAIVNGILAVFNLIPAFPLDGGRVLRALVWMATRSFERATRFAAGLGQGVGYLFIVFGLSRALLWGEDPIDSLWMAAIGWMLASAASQSLRRVAIDSALGTVTVGEIMTAPCPSVEIGQPLNEAVYEVLVRRRVTHAPVVDRGRLVGLLHAQHAQTIPQEYWAATMVAQVTQPLAPELVIGPWEPATRALFRMASEGASLLYVSDAEGNLLGCLTEGDLSQAVSIGMAVGRGAPQAPAGYRYPLPLAPSPASPVGPGEAPGEPRAGAEAVAERAPEAGGLG